MYIEGFCEQMIVRIRSISKTASENTFASNVNFHPKGGKRQRLEESASHHFKKLFKNHCFFAYVLYFSSKFCLKSQFFLIFQMLHFLRFFVKVARPGVPRPSANQFSFSVDQNVENKNTKMYSARISKKMIIHIQIF